MDNENSEKQNETEPISGQMRYDEILVPTTNEQEEEQQVAIIKGQMNFEDSIKLESQSNNKTNEVKNLDKITTDNLSDDNNGGDNGNNKLSGDGLILKSLEEVMHESMIPYTEHVVMDRALPRVEDGLKPVQRRILYSMLELNLQPDKQFKKSARIVGECMGKYHPHGDSSVYDAMVRLAQPYSMNEILVEGHGNFGSVDGDSAAAMRYTEAKLAPLAMELLRDLEKDTVHWSLNFDDTLKEPDLLPGRFPNLLVNGTSGIAVGVATNIPPHNLAEVIDAVVAYINKPSLKLEEIMHYIKAPDFPTGGQLIVGEELVNAYRTGKGKVIIRATASIEIDGDKQSIVITELPYQTNKSALLQKIAELKELNKDKLSAISEIRDESDRNGMRAVIKIKKEGNAKAILDYLFKYTGMQVSFGINMVAIAGGKPKQMGLLEIISYYAEYQRQIVFRRTKFDLEKCKADAHILEGLLIAINNIDEVVRIIKKSANVTDAKNNLKAKFDLSDKQVQAILDMRLGRLVNLEKEKIVADLKELKKRIEELTEIYNSKKKQYDVVKEEILEIKKKYKSPRKSAITQAGQVVYEEVCEHVAFARDVVIATTASKTIKIIPEKNYNLAQKDITDSSSLHDVHQIITKAITSQKVLLFTNLGNCLKINVGDIGEAKWREKGVTLASLDKNAVPGEYVVAIKPFFENEQEFMAKEQLIFFTKNGIVKKSEIGEYFIAKTFYQAIKLKDGDELISVENFDNSKSILMVSNQGMALNFENQEIPTTGRVSAGVKGINIDDKDYVIFASQVSTSGALTVGTEKGFIKNVPIGEFEIMSRYRKGLRAIPTNTTGYIIFARFGVVPPLVAIKTGSNISKVAQKNIVYDNRVGKGKQVYKQKIEGMFEYLS